MNLESESGEDILRRWTPFGIREAIYFLATGKCRGRVKELHPADLSVGPELLDFTYSATSSQGGVRRMVAKVDRDTGATTGRENVNPEERRAPSFALAPARGQELNGLLGAMAKLYLLNVNGASLLTTRAAMEMKLIAVMLTINFLFDLAVWTAPKAWKEFRVSGWKKNRLKFLRSFQL